MIGWGFKLGSLGILWAGGTSAFVVNSYVGQSYGGLVFGNYDGYISPDVLLELKSKYNLVPDYFDHDHIVKEKFEKNIYDMAIVSTSVLSELTNKSLSLELDWSKFGINKSSGEGNVSNHTDAKELFSPIVKSILGNNDEFLKYGIPYFLNKLSFCYRGDQISSLNSKQSWSQLIENISKEERFKSKNGYSKIAMIDDPRTIMSLARMTGEEDVNFSEGDVNMDNFYGNLSSKGFNSGNLGNNFLFINSSSAVIADALASGSVEGGFMYNGDCLYSLGGANFGESKKAEENKFHAVEMDKDIYFLDFITFSKNLSGIKLENAYKFVKDLIFDGMDQDDQILLKEGSDGEYKYFPMKNFDFVQYTPALNKVFDKLKSSYFENEKKDSLKEVKKKIFSIEKGSLNDYSIKKSFETYISEKRKSDMFIAFEKFKSNS